MAKPSFEQTEEFYRQVATGRINDKNYQKFLENPDSVLGHQIYEVLVDCRKSLAKMIEQCKLDWVNDDITAEHFPIQGKGRKRVKLELYRFDETVTGEEAPKRLDEAGYRAAAIEELLAFGKKFPDKQREFPIVALASSWRGSDGDLDVPYLDEFADGRDLYLRWLEGDFGPRYRFLVVGK